MEEGQDQRDHMEEACIQLQPGFERDEFGQEVEVDTVPNDVDEVEEPPKSKKMKKSDKSEGEARKRVKSLREKNCKMWKQMTERATKWVQSTHPYTPSFVVMHLKRQYGHEPQVVWAGAEHMAEFVDSVKETFVNFAIKRKIDVKGTNMQVSPVSDVSDCTDPHPLLSQPVELFSENVEDYTADFLALLLPRVMNPHGLRNFYCEVNRPQWFPNDMDFRAPTKKGGNENRKYSVKEMQTILKCFLEKCPSHYTIVQEDDLAVESETMKRKRKYVKKKTVTTTSAQGTEDSESLSQGTGENPIEEMGEDPLEGTGENPSGEDPLKEDPSRSSNLPIEERLRNVARYVGNWPRFKEEVGKMREGIEPMIHQGPVHLRQIPSNEWDKRRKQKLANIVPPGYYPVFSGADGDCLYNSTSIALKGNEEISGALRFATLCHAIDHYDHYFQMLKKEIPDVGDMHLFLNTVIVSDAVFEKRPQNSPTTDDLVHFALQEEIYSTSKLGAYSGYLQVLFVAGAIQLPFFQHFEVESMKYGSPFDNPIFPCSCQLDKITELKNGIHIMWVKMEDSHVNLLNHIIPLIPQGARNHVQHVPQTSTTVKLNYDMCMMNRYGQCNLTMFGDPSDESSLTGIKWMACDGCKSWYHSVCVGFHQDTFNDNAFYCNCQSLSASDLIAFEQVYEGKKIIAHSSDVRSLYPGNGVSDVVIDFYVCVWLPSRTWKYVLSTLSYQAIANACGSREATIQRFQSTTKYPLIDLLQEEMLIFPCKCQNSWHWIVVVVLIKDQVAFVLDSACDNALSQEGILTVKHIELFLKDAFKKIPLLQSQTFTLTPKAYEVSQQTNSVDCGVHVMHNIKLAVSCKPSDFIDKNSRVFQEPVDGKKIRGLMLLECYKANVEHVKQKKSKRTRRATDGTKVQDMILYKQKIKGMVEDGLKVEEVLNKGKGVFTTREFLKNDFICQYPGELISFKEAKERERAYSSEDGNFMYFFKHNEKTYCIDATRSERIGRYINHAKHQCNSRTIVVTVESQPHLCIIATRDLANGEEILYDYADRRKDVVKDHPWLKD